MLTSTTTTTRLYESTQVPVPFDEAVRLLPDMLIHFGCPAKPGSFDNQDRFVVWLAGREPCHADSVVISLRRKGGKGSVWTELALEAVRDASAGNRMRTRAACSTVVAALEARMRLAQRARKTAPSKGNADE